MTLHDLTHATPAIQFRHDGETHVLTCDVVAGCDGFHGVCRPSIPSSALTIFDREYPFAWLGILASAAALVRRARLQPARARIRALQHAIADRDAPVSAVRAGRRPDDMVRRTDLGRTRARGWARRTGGGRTRVPSRRRGVTGMRSFVVEPMRVRPPVPRRRRRAHRAADRREGPQSRDGGCGPSVRAGSTSSTGRGRRRLLDDYSDRGLRRTWRAQRFSWWMTSMLHRSDTERRSTGGASSPSSITSSARDAAMTSLAENYVGLPLD